MIKRVMGSFENSYEYTLVGIWGFTWWEIKMKIKLLRFFGYYYDGTYSPIREVKRFPYYCENIW